MKKICFILFLLFSTNLHSEDNALSIQHIMAMSKFTGLCGSFRQMLIFQDATLMEGGHEFIARFLKTESARIGYSSEEFARQCAEQIKKYKYWYELDL